MADTVTRAQTGMGSGLGSGFKLPVYKSGKRVQTALIWEGSLGPEAYGFWNPEMDGTSVNGYTYMSVQVCTLPHSRSFTISLWEKEGWTPVPFDLPPGSLPPPQKGQMLLLTLKGEGRGGK